MQRLEKLKPLKLYIENFNNAGKTCDEASRIPVSAADIHVACESGSNIDMDTALAVLPLGPKAGKAAYWVHHDNMIEILVLLLQFTRLRNPITSPNLTNAPSTPSSSRKGSMTGRSPAFANQPEDEIGVIICDDLQQFAKRRSAATVSDSENIPGNAAEKAVLSIRYASTGEAIVVIGADEDSIDSATQKRHVVQKAKLKKKALHELFDVNLVSAQARKRSHSDSTDVGLTETDEVQGFESVRLWLTNHPEVQPMVQMQTKRTRFVGLGNNESGGVWATLDKDILMRKCRAKASNSEEFLAFSEEDRNSETSKFPHAILEIRYENERGIKLVTTLDESHLVSITPNLE